MSFSQGIQKIHLVGDSSLIPNWRLKNAVLWMEYGKVCKMSLDSIIGMNGLLKAKVANYDFSLNYCESYSALLRKFIKEDDSIIQERDKTALKLIKTINTQGKVMKIVIPILIGTILGETVFILLK